MKTPIKLEFTNMKMVNADQNLFIYSKFEQAISAYWLNWHSNNKNSFIGWKTPKKLYASKETEIPIV